jgi:hypothetical protein
VRRMDIHEKLAAKSADIGALADQLIRNSKQIHEPAEILLAEQSSKKYAYENGLRVVSEKQPGLVYPYLDVFSSLLLTALRDG